MKGEPLQEKMADSAGPKVSGYRWRIAIMPESDTAERFKTLENGTIPVGFEDRSEFANGI